jgi:hypothetical protein
MEQSTNHLSSWTNIQVQDRIAELTNFQRNLFEEEKANGKPERYALFLAITWPENMKDRVIMSKPKTGQKEV